MDELSGRKREAEDPVELGWCPKCHCPESTVECTRKPQKGGKRIIEGRVRRTRSMVIVRYRRCVNCGASFRTTERVG